MAASSSTENKSSVPVKEKAMQYYLYPPPIARYEDVIASPKLFMDTLGNFHAAMGTKFKIPIIGGKDLDLHRLFMEVTSRGGIKRVLEEKKWREVTNSFSFPPSATNASFILRKYYMSLIHHFEQVYYFKAKAWTPVPTDAWQRTKSTLTSTSGMNKAVLPLPEIRMASLIKQTSPSADTQVTSVKRQRTMTEEDSLPKASLEPSVAFPVTGMIDGKFESGYLCTVRIGGEQLQGVLYQTVQTLSCEIPQHEGAVPQLGTMNATQASTTVRRRRRRRKKSEMRKRDPAHPKPNRSGYNFFFAEQHARLKLLHPGKDRDISRMIGELWNKLTESEKAVYQEKAVKDKERYRTEMEHYRESLRTGLLISNAVPLQQQSFMPDANMVLVENAENDGESHQTPENEQASGYSDNDKSSFEGEEKTTDKDSNLGIPLAVEMGAETVDMETVAGQEDLGLAEIGRGGKECMEGTKMKPKAELLFGEHKKSSDVEDDQSVFLDESRQQKSMFVQENEPVIIENESVRIHENESKHDGKSPCDEPRIPDINDENKTKSANNQEKDFVATQEKVSARCDGIAENGPLNASEERDMEIPVHVREREIVIREDKVGNMPEAFHQKELVDIAENLEKDPQVFQETVSAVREGGVHVLDNTSLSSEEKVGLKAKEGQSLYPMTGED